MMKKIITILLLSVSLAMTFVSGEAIAKRMGSGSDSGMQRSVTPATPASSKTPSSPAAAPAAAGAASTAASAAGKSSMMGPLLGLAAGGLLAAAFMGGAFDGISPMDIILLLLIAGGIFFFLRRRAATASAKVDEVFAQIVEWSQDAGNWVLTVRFNGYLSEQEGAFPHAFSEYWHLVRLGEADGEWKLAGIQQDN